MKINKLLLTVALMPLIAATTVACGGGGNGGTTVSPPPPPVADTTSPSVSFSPTTLTVESGGTGATTLTVTDNIRVTSGPTISCTNGGSFINNVFTAPDVTANTTSICTATASDAAGNTGTGTLTVTITAPPPDTAAPTVSFNPTTVNVSSGGTVTSTLTATDNVGVAGVPTVTCTQGSFNVSTNQYSAPVTTTDLTATCTATASDAAGNSGSGTLTVNVAGVVPGAKVTLSGRTTFDYVPFQSDNTGLDYNNISQRPIRGHVVELVSSAGAILSSSLTDASGNYSFEVDPNTQVRVRVKAQLLKTTGNTWDARVIDNTNSNVLYALQSAVTNSGNADRTLNLNAASGWGGTSYTSTRAAAPFAILSPIYDTLQVFEGSSTDRNFPRANFNWSTNNKSVPPVNGNRTTGNIGTSSYVGNGNIYILGNENSDTDEYDDHVIVHEWGHYFEDQLSRSDSIGGGHSNSQKLDMRVAMGEGWGNALSGIGTGDPIYKDSLNSQQSQGFSFNVESDNFQNPGWFNEASVQEIIYDIFDSNDDGADTISLGIDPIFAAFVSDAYKQEPAFTSIFSFINQVRANSPANDAALTAMLAAQTINGTGPQGTGETNNGAITSSLPVYKTLTVGGAAVNVCSVNDAGGYNKLGNRAYLTVTPAASGNHTITATRTSGPASTDPDFQIFNAGTLVANAFSNSNNSETRSLNLVGGTTYAIDFTEDSNTSSTGTGLDACFNVTVTN